MSPAVLVELLGPGDPVPDSVELLRSTAPPGHDLLVCTWLADQVFCIAFAAPDRALAGAHAAAEHIEDRGQRPRVVFGADGRRLVAKAARAVAAQEEDGRHRHLVDAIRPRWDRLVAELTPSTRH